MCGLYKNLFRHFLKEQANKLVDCHNYNLRLDPPPPPPKSRMNKPREDQNVSNLGGGEGGGTGRVQVFHCPRKYGRLLVRELWIESVLKAENPSNLVSDKQKDRVGKMGQSHTRSKQKFSFTIRIHQVTIL